jgi:hypothetical protein
MVTKKKGYRLTEIQWPDFGSGPIPAAPSLAEISGRIDSAREAMEKQGLTHLVVYADRECFANLTYLINFDPRFEEALLVMDRTNPPLLLVGNECEARLPVSPLYAAGKLRSERYQPLSLLDQPRERSRQLKDIFSEEGINNRSRVGCVGHKYFSDQEHPDGEHTLDIPSYIADTLRSLAGTQNVVNATAIFMHPAHGLRATCSPAEIAFFEFANVLASEGMKRVLLGVEDGIRDFDLAKKYEYNGFPLNCYICMVTGENRHLGLSGPTGTIIRRGTPLVTNLAYWGSNICRGGWVVKEDGELPGTAQGYAEGFAGPYFAAVAGWISKLKVGTPGGELYDHIHDRLPDQDFGIYLNPGHLIHYDEWVSSPVYKDSKLEIRSGMYMQTDIIPSSEKYFTANMEDGLIIADRTLRDELRNRYPECFARCQKRRDFMINTLGIGVPEEVLPLSNIPSLLPPFFLNPNLVFTLS